MKCPTCRIEMVYDKKYNLWECVEHGAFESEDNPIERDFDHNELYGDDDPVVSEQEEE